MSYIFKYKNKTHFKNKIYLNLFIFKTFYTLNLKTIICRKGKIFFVAVNINKNSKNYLKCFTYILSSKKNVIINIKKGFATGFLTLEKNSEILYLMSNFYNKFSSLGINYKSDKININWPIKPRIISKKDRSLPSS
jgi:dTDP-4-dehydrorhamnose 3,5-epimerase